MPRNPGANIVSGLMVLLSRLPPEGIYLVEQLISSLVRAKDPLRAVRLAALVAASKRATEEAIVKVIGR
jgi:hypothetical protein